jgi:hypothetical protein
MKGPTRALPQPGLARANMIEMSFSEWQDALLKHPDGRAAGGEPCVKSGRPVPPDAHWKQRDRHVCSERCNNNLKRQLKRAMARGDEMPVPRPEPMPDPRTVPVPWTFTTLDVPDRRTGTRYTFDGLGPQVGDVVERHGVRVTYGWTPSPQVWAEHAPHGFITVTEALRRYAQWWTCDENRRIRRTCFGLFDPAGLLVTQERHGVLAGRSVRWALEIIRDVTANDRPYDWEAPVCVPADAPYDPAIWTLAYQTRSERLRPSTGTRSRPGRWPGHWRR